MEARFPTQDTVRGALVALLQAKGYDHPGDWVDVAVLSKGGPPIYRVTPASQAASVLADELASITGRSLARDASWFLFQGDVNLLFGAVRQVARRVNAQSDSQRI
jgi:hypothetical protein